MSEARKRKKKKKHVFAVTLFRTVLILGILAAAFYIGKDFLKKKIEEKAAETIVNEMTKSDAAQTTLPDGRSAQNVYNSMSEDDKETVQNIVDNHMDAKTAKELQKYASSGDTESLKQYADDNLTEEEKAQLEELYEKYK